MASQVVNLSTCGVESVSFSASSFKASKIGGNFYSIDVPGLGRPQFILQNLRVLFDIQGSQTTGVQITCSIDDEEQINRIRELETQIYNKLLDTIFRERGEAELKRVFRSILKESSNPLYKPIIRFRTNKDLASLELFDINGKLVEIKSVAELNKRLSKATIHVMFVPSIFESSNMVSVPLKLLQMRIVERKGDFPKSNPVCLLL